jgi:uncharacterized membrane protein
MVLMALDHSRDFVGGFGQNPTDLATTTPLLFFTRWVTHFCAPVFVFLAGTSAYLAGQRRTRPELFRFLLTRGLWLVVLELTVVRFGWMLNVNYKFVVFQVIWAIGWSMVVLAFLQFLPIGVVAAVALLVICGHNLLDVYRARDFGDAAWMWNVFHEQGLVQPSPERRVFVAYPLMPWFAVMAAGYAAGALWRRPDRKRLFMRLGVAVIGAFVVLRGLDAYGDPSRWQVQGRGVLYTFLSFLNCSKYPPSLLYLLMTLGPALCVVSWLDRPWETSTGAVSRLFSTYGRVPLFYYVMHLFVIHAVVLAVCAPQLFDAAFRARLLDKGAPGYGLGVTYLVWVMSVALLYPLCRWFCRVKARNRGFWVSYV